MYLGRTGTGREQSSLVGGSGEEDKEVDELGEEEDEEPPEVGLRRCVERGQNAEGGSSLGRTGTGREHSSLVGGSGEEDKEVDELGEEEEEEPPEVGDVSSAVKTPKAAARDTSPESDLQRLRVLL